MGQEQRQEKSHSSSSQSNSEPPKKKRRGGIGIVAKMTLAMAVIGIAPLMAFGAFTLWQQNTRMRVEADQSMQTYAQLVSAQVDEWIDKNVRVLQTAAELAPMATMVREDQARILTAIQQAFPWALVVFTVGRDAKNIARSDTQPLRDYSDRNYVKQALSGKAISWETVIGKTSGKPVLVLSVPIRSGGAVVGALAMSMNIEDISRIVATWKSGTTGYAFLVDETAKVVAHPQSSYALSERRLADHPLISAFSKDGNPHVLQFVDGNVASLGAVHGTHMHWAVAVQQQESEVFAPLRQTLRLGLGLLGGATLLVGLFALILSRVLVRPITDMTNATDEMSLGNLDKPISAPGSDEIAVLAKSLERLRKSMKFAMDRLNSN